MATADEFATIVEAGLFALLIVGWERESVMGDNIKHIILLLLENRSFDHVLGCFKGVKIKSSGDTAK